MQELLHAGAARLLHHERAHHEVVVEVGARVALVRADPSDASREVHDDLRPGVGDQPCRVRLGGEVVVRAARDDRVTAGGAQPLADVMPEEAGAAGHEHPPVTEEVRHGVLMLVARRYGKPVGGTMRVGGLFPREAAPELLAGQTGCPSGGE